MKKVLADGTPYNATKGKSTQLDTLTGEEFKQLIEQFSRDGKINTIPELIAFLNDIPEGMTLAEYVAEHGIDPEQLEQAVNTAVDDKFDEEQCSDDDIDSIFDGQQNGDDAGQGGGEDTDDDDTGFETNADDGEDDV